MHDMFVWGREINSTGLGWGQTADFWEYGSEHRCSKMVGFLKKKKKGREFIEQWTWCEVKKKDNNSERTSVLVSHTHRLRLRDSYSFIWACSVIRACLAVLSSEFHSLYSLHRVPSAVGSDCPLSLSFHGAFCSLSNIPTNAHIYSL